MVQILEAMDCDVTTFMKREDSKRPVNPGTDRLTRDDAIFITHTIGMALLSLHRRLITHLDVKPDNVLLRVDSQWNILKDENGIPQIKIGDFGTAKYLGGDDR